MEKNKNEKNENKGENKSEKVAGMVAGVYMNMLVKPEVVAGVIVGLDKGYVKFTFAAPPSKLDKETPPFIFVNDRRRWVVDAVKAIKNLGSPTRDELEALRAEICTPAYVQVQSFKGHDFVNLYSPKEGSKTRGNKLTIDYYRPTAPVPEQPTEGKGKWCWFSPGVNGTVQLMLVEAEPLPKREVHNSIVFDMEPAVETPMSVATEATVPVPESVDDVPVEIVAELESAEPEKAAGHDDQTT